MMMKVTLHLTMRGHFFVLKLNCFHAMTGRQPAELSGLVRAVQESYDLRTAADDVRTEFTIAGALGDVFCDGPVDCIAHGAVSVGYGIQTVRGQPQSCD